MEEWIRKKINKEKQVEENKQGRKRKIEKGKRNKYKINKTDGERIN